MKILLTLLLMVHTAFAGVEMIGIESNDTTATVTWRAVAIDGWFEPLIGDHLLALDVPQDIRGPKLWQVDGLILGIEGQEGINEFSFPLAESENGIADLHQCCFCMVRHVQGTGNIGLPQGKALIEPDRMPRVYRHAIFPIVDYERICWFVDDAGDNVLINPMFPRVILSRPRISTRIAPYVELVGFHGDEDLGPALLIVRTAANGTWQKSIPGGRYWRGQKTRLFRDFQSFDAAPDTGRIIVRGSKPETGIACKFVLPLVRLEFTAPTYVAP